MIVRNEGSLQAHWDPVAGNACGRDLDVAAADQRSAANCSKETLLLRRRPNDIRWSLSVGDVGSLGQSRHCNCKRCDLILGRSAVKPRVGVVKSLAEFGC